MRTLFHLSLIAAGTVAATAQVLHPDVRDKVTDTPAQPAQGGSSQVGGGGQNQNQQKSNSPMGNELPFFDPSGEVVAWNGHTWAATDNRLIAARFERFLNEPEEDSEAAKEYRETIAQILEQVSPHHPGGPNFAGGVRLLPKASSFPADAKLCDSLSQAIYTAVYNGLVDPERPRTWMELLFLSATNLSATGLGDVLPIHSAARVLVVLEQFCGVGYIAVVVARLIGLTVAGAGRVPWT